MESIISRQTDRDVLMSRLASWLAEERHDDALLALEEFLNAEPQDRECQLLRLLCNINIHGLELYETEIEKLKSLSNLACREKVIIKRVLALAIKQARREQRENQAAAYQRLLRRLVRASSLSDSSSTAEKIMEIGSIIRVWFFRVFTLQGSVPAKELGLPLAGLLGLVLMSVSLLQQGAENPRKQAPARIPAVRQVASENFAGVRDLRFRVSRIGIEQSQEASNAGKFSQPQAARERQDTTITQASSLKKEKKDPGPPTPRGKGRSARADNIKRASGSQKLSPRERRTNPGQISAKRVSPSEIELDHLGIYTARFPIQVRKKLGFGAPTLETIAAGTEVSVLEARGDWFKVRTHGRGNVGYVRKEFIVPANSP